MKQQRKPSHPTLVRALKESWPLSRDTRFRIIGDLMKAGLPINEDLHMILKDAVNEEEPEERLVKLLLDYGASPLANQCATLVDATTRAASGCLSLLLKQDVPPRQISTAFSQAFTEANFDNWFTESGLSTAQQLLDKGATGQALSGALVLVMTKSDEGCQELADMFVDSLVAHGVDVDYHGGEPLRLAASRANASWARKLLTLRPCTETLSLGFQHIFDTALSEDEAFELFDMFSDYRDGDICVDVMAPQPGSEPVLVRALSQYPRSTRILESLLDAGYYYDQTTCCRIHPDVDEDEEVTLLTWAVAQPQKKISTAVIDLLLQRGGM